jgi:hypothetical protein
VCKVRLISPEGRNDHNRRHGDSSQTGRRFIRSGAPSPTNKDMKKTIMSILCAGIASAVAIGAETTTTSTTTTTTGTGVIEEYTPGSTFVVKEKAGPVKYRYGKKVTYVTKSGKSLSDDEVRTRIRVGSPVSVYYDSDGEEKVINKVEIDD